MAGVRPPRIMQGERCTVKGPLFYQKCATLYRAKFHVEAVCYRGWRDDPPGRGDAFARGQRRAMMGRLRSWMRYYRRSHTAMVRRMILEAASVG